MDNMTEFDTFMNNPSWKTLYDNATSEQLKEYYKFNFERNLCADEEYKTKLKEIRSKFTTEDWQYLINTTQNLTAKIEFTKMMNKCKEQGLCK